MKFKNMIQALHIDLKTFEISKKLKSKTQEVCVGKHIYIYIYIFINMQLCVNTITF